MKNVLLLLCQGTELFEAAAFYDVLGWSGANGPHAVKVTTAGPRSPVTCTFGLKLIPDLLIDQDNADHIRQLMGFAVGLQARHPAMYNYTPVICLPSTSTSSD